MRVGIGVDGSASNDGSNLMQEVRAAFLLQRGRYGVDQGQPPGRVALGDQGLGGLRRAERYRRDQAGAQADLALFKLDELRFSGSGDPLAALVLCGAYRADRVMVGGRWTVENGEIPGLELDALMRRHSDAARKLQSAH